MKIVRDETPKPPVELRYSKLIKGRTYRSTSRSSDDNIILKTTKGYTYLLTGNHYDFDSDAPSDTYIEVEAKVVIQS